MKSPLRIFALLLIFHLAAWKLSAQPANDDCAGAFEVIISESEEHAVLTFGDTRGATASSIPDALCSPSWYTDDIFFKFTTPSVIDSPGIVIRAYFDPSIFLTDVRAIGMALYASCDSLELSSHCFSSALHEDDHIEISGLCLLTDHTYFLRVWSTGSDSTTEGTLRIGIYPGQPLEKYLWWETFDGGLEVNGWTTNGTCAFSDSNDIDADFKYLPDGIIDMGCYAPAGTGIKGITFCNGAVGVDSDYNDCCDFGTCHCNTPGHHFLLSPVLFSGDWDGAGLTLTWTQALRQFQSTFFISYRTRNVTTEWADWIDLQVNTEFPINSTFYIDNIQRFFLPGAAGHDSIQIRFIYNDNYYFWAIDDVKIVETECSNTRIQADSFAIAPFAQMPSDQVNPFVGFADIFNGGACRQSGGMLNYLIQDTATKEIVYNQSIHYEPIGSDSFAVNQIIPTLINLPDHPADYLATYTFTQDSADFNPLDNVIRYYFSAGGNTFALEDGFTRVITFDHQTGAPHAYTYGNYFRPAKDVTVDHIRWGVYNPSDMAGKAVNVNLIQWSDNNHDQISQSSERKIIGSREYIFSGDDEIINTELENLIEPGSPVIMKGGIGYMAMIEYKPTLASEPQLYLWASEARNYTAQQIATDSAISLGLNIPPVYFSVLGLSADGNISDIDYEVRELNENDTRVYPGDNIVPAVRIIVSPPDTTNTKSELSSDNLITVYPNPSSDEIYINMEFKRPYQHVQLRLVNTIGQTVFSKTLSGSITNHIEPINISHLAAGNYMLQVETPDGQRSIPVMIAK